MSDKKHIDRLFQESFKDFEAIPSDAVWENIEAKLNQKKKKRRVIPIWWRYAGAAALLLLLLTIGGVYFNNADKIPTNEISDIEATTPSNSEKDNPTNLDKAKDDVIADTDSNENESLDDTPQQNKTNLPSNKITPSKESSIAETPASNNNEREEASSVSINKGQNTINKLLNTKSSHVVAKNLEEKSDNDKIPNKSKNNHVIADNSEEKKNTDKLQNTIKNSSAITSDSGSEKKNQAIQQNKSSLINKERAKEVIDNASKNNNAIAEVKNENKETATNDKTEKNSLTIEEAIDKTKDIVEEEKDSNRWSIAPNAAPVYFNTLGEGSSIDPQFNNNSKSGELNMSYGISASYAINKKLSVRSGVHRVNLGYNTNNVVAFQTVGVSSSSRSLQNVNAVKKNNTSNTPDNVSLVSAESFNANDIPEAFSTSKTSINQDLGYIEIPLEIQYALSNKKLGVNLIGGFSSFFLSNNKIFSESEGGTRTLLGKANNINKVSYSANFGLGLNYQVSKKIDLNLEPMFKYQINTFNNTSGDFKPFFIGVYTGFAIKF
ncbi:hypothetical protein [Flavivirga spongiicola]|uniref:Outer membrane protein beta-barrel domain-containing protein n=1 Tax=Flavivirga spongiicola TaxID=421621 RepID=A0ABU7XTF2_9FLAO|nr:hypothetical protein [Flavivirga sp. MEBiC05379]MDO5978782.1 hypothetical protein [Flavivirga sp. MEBiC05379]